jgi:hypothetical protein
MRVSCSSKLSLFVGLCSHLELIRFSPTRLEPDEDCPCSRGQIQWRLFGWLIKINKVLGIIGRHGNTSCLAVIDVVQIGRRLMLKEELERSGDQSGFLMEFACCGNDWQLTMIDTPARQQDQTGLISRQQHSRPHADDHRGT